MMMMCADEADDDDDDADDNDDDAENPKLNCLRDSLLRRCVALVRSVSPVRLGNRPAVDDDDDDDADDDD
eukprot:10308296-Karenia_brevis.AAC.1